jgi:hypothetical protein
MRNEWYETCRNIKNDPILQLREKQSITKSTQIFILKVWKSSVTHLFLHRQKLSFQKK